MKRHERWWWWCCISFWGKERVDRLAVREDVARESKDADNAAPLALLRPRLVLQFWGGTLSSKSAAVAVINKEDLLALISKVFKLASDNLSITIAIWSSLRGWKDIESGV